MLRDAWQQQQQQQHRSWSVADNRLLLKSTTTAFTIKYSSSGKYTVQQTHPQV